MYRATPKIVVLVAIAAVIGAIYYVTEPGLTARQQDSGVVYIDTGIGKK